jgi:Ca2+-binding EF-hand superfamily protein
MRERLRAADANNDGKISKDEAPDFLQQRFDRIDANQDGFLDEMELRQIGPRLLDSPNRPADRRPDGGRPGSERPKRDDQ